jgi:hypothetical protein
VSVDGTGGIAAGNADLAALVDAELAQLAADAQALRGLLVEDAIVTARVLPSNGLTDLIEIAGRRVAASLPPTVRPGDVLQVQVTGFDGDRILMQIVGTGGDVAVETGPSPAPVAPDPAVFVQASIQPAAPSAAGAAPPPAPPAMPPSRPPVGPAFASVVTRANVAPSAAAPGPAGAAPAASAEAASPSAAAARAADAPARTAGPPAEAEIEPGTTAPAAVRGTGAMPPRPIAMPPETTPIEARLDASRASGSPPPASGASVASGAPALAGRPSPASAAPSRFVAPPPIEPKAPPAPQVRPSPATYAEPVALLRALRLPVTPSNVTSATVALERPSALAPALAALEAALPPGRDDANVATLRTLLAFVGRIDPRSPVLSAQLAAFVDQVVDGAEPKLATLLAAHAVATPGTSNPVPAPPTLAAAVAAERGAALSADLKQTLLSVAASPSTPASLAPSLASAVTALTAVQVSAAQALAANPNGIAFAVPLATANGTANAQITITREAPGRGAARPDAGNFRIAFVLDTAHYGTVAIDLVTVGRDVTVDVRTESAPAMRAFRDALGGLVTRLESLRYNVASAAAAVGTTSTVAVEGPPAAASDPDAAVDSSA